MKNILSRLLIIVTLFLLLPLSVFGQQSNKTSATFKRDIGYENITQDWTIPAGLSVGAPNTASFYWMITRSKYPVSGINYQYKIYFYSNSRYANNQWAGTYMDNVYLIVDNVYIAQGTWVMFKDVYTHPFYHFYSPSLAPYVTLGWGNIRIN